VKLEQLSHYGVVQPSRVPAAAPRPAGRQRVEGELRKAAGCEVVATHCEPDHRHGWYSPHGVAGLSGRHLSLICRDPELAYLETANAVFLDTETTGLGLGVGTYVFLVGAGYVHAGTFQVKQFFLAGPQTETSFLDELDAFLRQFSAIVTFNGKAFDWPLLENRFVLHRREPPLRDPLHVDLLHPARRLWKRRLESCALSSLEAHILGVERTEQDVPGYLIPQLYFDYLSGGDRRTLDPVFYHNLQDVLSLASLSMHIDRVVGDPHGGAVSHGADYASLGRAYERAGDLDRAMECYEEALHRLPAGAERRETLIGLAGLQKRERRWDGAHLCWQQLLDEGGEGALFARVELAKYAEHVERDFMQAIDHVQHALEMAEDRDTTLPGASRRDLEHRLGRLVNRAVRSRSWVGV